MVERIDIDSNNGDYWTFSQKMKSYYDIYFFWIWKKHNFFLSLPRLKLISEYDGRLLTHYKYLRQNYHTNINYLWYSEEEGRMEKYYLKYK